MNELSLFIFLAALLIISTGITHLPIERSLLTEPLLAMLVGIAVGPFGLTWFKPDQWDDSLHLMNYACAYTMAMALMATALRLPGRYPITAAGYQLVLILGGMALMTVFSAGIFYVAFGWSILFCVLVGAIVSPTDPVLATAVVSSTVADKNIPARLRHLISGESGANDGAAYPIVLLPLLLIDKPEGAWREWLLHGLLYRNVLAILIAVAIGYVARLALKWAVAHERTTPKAFLSYTVALGFLTLTGLNLIGCNGIIGVFAAGLVFNSGMFQGTETEDQKVQEMMERLFLVPVFLLFGVLVPWAEIGKLGWPVWLAAILVLFLRRLPALFVLRPFLKPLQHTRDTLFVGWFGPIGVAALYYATHVHEQYARPEIWAVPSVVIFCSVIAHGVTCYPFNLWYTRNDRAASSS